MKYSLIPIVILAIAYNAFAQDACTQLRSGWREVERERAQLCSEYVGTCAFLETAEKKLKECGDKCSGDLVIAIGGCVVVIGMDNCNYVANRFTDFQKRRQRIQSLATERGCLLF